MPTIKFISGSHRSRIGVWQLLEVHTGHCPGKCYIFDNGRMGTEHRYHIPANHFWGKPWM